MAAAPRVSRAALEAAAKAAGLNIRKITPAQKRALCAAASAGANGGPATTPTGTGAPGAGLAAAGIGAKGPGATGAGLATACLGINGAAGAGLGTKGTGIGANGAGTSNGVPGAGLAAANLGANGTHSHWERAGAAGLRANGVGLVAAGSGACLSGGISVGAPAVALSSVNGPAGLGAARTGASSVRVGTLDAGGHGRGGAASAMFGIRAGLSTKATAAGCAECAAECAKMRSLCNEMGDSFQRRTRDITEMYEKLFEEVVTIKKEVATYKTESMRMTIGVMVTGLGTVLAVFHYFSPYVQKAWQSETIAEVDRQAAARRYEAAQGGVKGQASAAAPPTSAVPRGAVDQDQKGQGHGGK